jgi:hypothetical protein
MKTSVSTKRRALSQVVTMLMILVVSVLMAGGTMTYYTMAVTSSTMKTEQLVINEAHIWVDATGAQGGIRVENIGGRDALITAVEIRFVEEPWSSVYYAEGDGGTLTPTQDLNITGPFTHTVGDESLNFTQATGSLLLPVSGSILLYVDQPDSIDISDLGYMVQLSVCTSTIQYISVVDVEMA